nr:hypothetical protein [Tanacetum cinerariifolium]
MSPQSSFIVPLGEIYLDFNLGETRVTSVCLIASALYASAACLLCQSAFAIRFLTDLTAGKGFPRDSPVDVVDGDMFLDTLLNNNPTQIKRYPEEFFVLLGLSRMRYVPTACPVFYDDDDDQEMNFQSFIKVPNPFDVVCTEKKITKNKKPLLEHIVNVVTHPSDTAVNLDVVSLAQVSLVATRPPPINTRKRYPPRTSILESTSKKGKNPESSSSVAISKAEEFVLGITSAAPKRLGFKGKKFVAPKKPLSKKVLFTILPPKSAIGESAAGSKVFSSESSTSTRSEPLVSSRPGPRSDPCLITFRGLFFYLIQESVKTPRKDWFYASMIIDPSVDVCDRANVSATRHITLFSKIRLRLENPKLEMSKLERRLGLEEAEKEVLRLKKQVDNLEAEANKRRFDDRVAVLDARLDKMAKETDEEFAPMLRDTKVTKEFLVRKGFHYFLNKFKKSDVLGSYLSSCIFAAIYDGMKQVKACADQPFSYLEALLVMGVLPLHRASLMPRMLCNCSQYHLGR